MFLEFNFFEADISFGLYFFAVFFIICGNTKVDK